MRFSPSSVGLRVLSFWIWFWILTAQVSPLSTPPMGCHSTQPCSRAHTGDQTGESCLTSWNEYPLSCHRSQVSSVILNHNTSGRQAVSSYSGLILYWLTGERERRPNWGKLPHILKWIPTVPGPRYGEPFSIIIEVADSLAILRTDMRLTVYPTSETLTFFFEHSRLETLKECDDS